jgi:hypothetical protein
MCVNESSNGAWDHEEPVSLWHSRLYRFGKPAAEAAGQIKSAANPRATCPAGPDVNSPRLLARPAG